MKLRSALDAYPAMKAALIRDPTLMDRDRTEFLQKEAALPVAEQLGRRHWSGLSDGLQDLAQAVGLGSDYALLYKLYSGAAHANRPWDQAPFRADTSLVIPTLSHTRATGISLSFNTWRYLAWCLAAACDSGALALYPSEQRALDQYRHFLEPVEILFAKGIIGAGASPTSAP